MTSQNRSRRYTMSDTYFNCCEKDQSHQINSLLKEKIKLLRISQTENNNGYLLENYELKTHVPNFKFK